jgi:hypothetical protein
MITPSVPKRHWRSYGNDPLPTAQEALGEPFAAFPSWFLRIECDRCGKERMLNEAHASDAQRYMLLRDLLARARHEGCGGRAAAKVELLTGTEAASSGPVRRMVLIAGNA